MRKSKWADSDEEEQPKRQEKKRKNAGAFTASYTADPDDFEDIFEQPSKGLFIRTCRSIEHYERIEKIAEGSYGIVYKGKDKETSELVALKLLKLEGVEEHENGFPLSSLREITALMRLEHPNIVQLREMVVAYEPDEEFFMVMEYADTDLRAISRQRAFNEAQAKAIIEQILSAVLYLHENGVIHRDIKTSNLLLVGNQVKLADFGMSRIETKPMTDGVVTLWYRAPEVLLGSNEYTRSIDIWSVGCVFAELLLGRALFNGETEIDQISQIFRLLGTPSEEQWHGFSQLRHAKKFEFEQFNDGGLQELFRDKISSESLIILEQMLEYDPVQRITARKALESLQ